MKLLALDTSTAACSVAINLDGKIFESHLIEAKSHTRVLLPAISGLLDDAKIIIDDIDAVVLGIGPGSFVGMRIGASVAQGLAFAGNIKIIPVSSMETIALEILLTHDLDELVVIQDARMNEVYIGEYKLNLDGVTEVLSPIKLQSISECANEYSNQQKNIVGIGFTRNPESIKNINFTIDLEGGVGYPRANYLLVLAERKYFVSAMIEPENLILDYIRQEVASKPNK